MRRRRARGSPRADRPWNDILLWSTTKKKEEARGGGGRSVSPAVTRPRAGLRGATHGRAGVEVLTALVDWDPHVVEETLLYFLTSISVGVLLGA